MNTKTHKHSLLHWLEFSIPVLIILTLVSSLVNSSRQQELGGILIRSLEIRQSVLESPTKPSVQITNTNKESASESLRARALLRRSYRLNTAKKLRALPARRSATNPVEVSETLHSAAEDFPEAGNVIFPVVRVPNWGAMYSASEWNRSFDQMPNSAFVAVPEYDLTVLTTPMNQLLNNREANVEKITAKLLYSTRHFGSYDLDSDEYTGKHAGIDLKLAEGTPFTTIAGGRVYKTGNEKVLGNYVIVEHRINGEVYYSMYGHMKDIYVQENQDLRSGEVIGTVGSTGYSTGPHIHLQVNKGSNPNWRSTKELSKSEASKYTIHPIEFINAY